MAKGVHGEKSMRGKRAMCKAKGGGVAKGDVHGKRGHA